LNNLLLKISVGLAAFILLLGSVSILTVGVSNHVRQQHYWTDVVTPGMKFVAGHPEFLDPSVFSSLSVVAKDQPQIGDLIRARLDLGQVVFIEVDNLYKVYVDLGSNLLLELESDQSGRSIYELYVWLVQRALEMQSFEDLIQSGLVSNLGVDLSKVDNQNLLSSQFALDSLVERGQHLVLSQDSVMAMIRTRSGEIYKIDFAKPFSPISVPVLIVLVLACFGALFMAVFLFIRGYERKLRNVETVAARIARGELDARVKGSAGSEALERLSSAFNAMADHIQRLMMVQKEMIHAVSHELRTPVARIRFGVQMIEDCQDQSSLQNQVKGIDSDIQELDELIDEILTYARLEQGGPILTFQDANVFDIVEQVVAEQKVGKPNLTIESELEAQSEECQHTEIEARYIHRSIQNLVGNATRYAKGRVMVSCYVDQDTCRVDVEDDGPGIPEAEWESVFTPFARLDDSRTRSSGGYGLGLSIVRRILYWHGGQAFLGQSDSLGGAKFSLVWPRLQSRSATPPQSQSL
jgi:two-component system sensor histidine kinase RstB